VLVLDRELAPAKKSIPLVEHDGRRGFVDMNPTDPDVFLPIAEVHIPDVPAYLVLDVDTGRETLNVTPDDALPLICREGAITAHDRGRSRRPDAPPRDPPLAERLLGRRLPPERQESAGTLDEQGRTAARVVLGRQPAHVARHGLLRREDRSLSAPRPRTATPASLQT